MNGLRSCGTYTQWNITRALKRINNAICSNMDGTRDSHTKGSKSERERQIPYDITYMWNPKLAQMNLSTEQKQTHECREQIYCCQGVGGESGMDREQQIQTIAFGVANQ